jgi:DNA polymerase III subunit delta
MATRAKKPEGDPLAHLKDSGPRAVYAVDGDERILVDEAVAQIKAAALSGPAKDFNLDLLDARDAPIQRILDAAATLPAFAPQRLVVVKNIEKWEKEDESKDKLAPLLSYIANPSPTTVLLLIASDKLDGRLRLYRQLDKAGVLIRFTHPNEREMPELVRRRAKSIGLSLDEEAVRAIVDAVGANMSGVIESLEKLALYTGEKKSATRRDVEEVVSPAREESIFEFADAVGGRNLPSALALLHSMMDVSRSHPLAILGMLARHWRNLIVARTSIDTRAPPMDLASELRLPPFVVDRVIAQAKKQQLGALVSGLSAIAETDGMLKGGKLEHARAMERLVMALIGVDRRDAPGRGLGLAVGKTGRSVVERA